MRLHNRLSGHRASIKRLGKGENLNSQMNDTGCAKHFIQSNHNFDRDAELHILETGDWKNAPDRKTRESFFICKFGTLEPKGMNKATGPLGEFYGKI